MLSPYYQGSFTEAGCDEAGRGCLAGPVCAAAVILRRDFGHELLNDSKQMTPEDRETLRVVIEGEALSWAVAFVDNRTIDRINILQASFRAMHLAVRKLSLRPGLLLVDGNRFNPYRGIPHQCIIQGDAQYASIAAASVLAKTYRDAYMVRLHQKHPGYSWDENKGYPTEKHRNGIRELGCTSYHRLSFRLLPENETGFDPVALEG